MDFWLFFWGELTMELSETWHLLHQPAYRSPSVFDLNNSGRFKEKPYVSKPYGIRLMINGTLEVKVECVYLVKKDTFDELSGIRYSHIVERMEIPLNSDMELGDASNDHQQLPEIIRNEIKAVHGTWYDNTVAPDGNKIDRAQLEEKLKSAIDLAKKQTRDKIKAKNQDWIHSLLPRKMVDFNRGLYSRMADQLYPCYQDQEGKEDEATLIRKINLFSLIFDNEDDHLVKANGNVWQDEAEQWNCWIAFAGSESEAERIHSVMMSVFPEVRDTLAHEVSSSH